MKKQSPCPGGAGKNCIAIDKHKASFFKGWDLRKVWIDAKHWGEAQDQHDRWLLASSSGGVLSLCNATMHECPYIGFIPHAGAGQDIGVCRDVPEAEKFAHGPRSEKPKFMTTIKKEDDAELVFLPDIMPDAQ